MAGVLTQQPRAAGTATGADRTLATRPVGTCGFAAVAIASLGGPLALAALMGPGLLGDAGGSAGFVALSGLLVSLAPLAIWLRFSQRMHSSAGLTGFVEAAAGRRVALVHAGIWTVSYLLYLVYTTVQIVYDLLPAVVPGARGAQSALTILLPVALIAVMAAGRTATLVALGVVAAGQLVLAGWLDGVSIAHLNAPASTFAPGADLQPVAKAGAQASLLYVCGSLPLFLGGELARPRRTITRVLPGAVALAGVVVVAAMAPLAAAPGLSRTAIPGMTVMEQFAGAGPARAVGIGVMASIAAVMLCEYLALTRLGRAVSPWSSRTLTAGIGVVMLAATPIILADPQGAYDTLLEPSMVALWLSQLIVFACYPRFARRAGRRLWPAVALSSVACAWALYALWLAGTSTSS